MLVWRLIGPKQLPPGMTPAVWEAIRDRGLEQWMSPRSEYGGGGVATVPTAHREAAGTSLEQGLVVDEVDLEHGCGGNSFRRRGSTSLGCLHHRAGPLALLSPPFLPPPPHARRLKTQHRRAGTVLSFIFGRMESRGVATEWESPKTLRRDLRMQIPPASLVGSGLPGRAPPLSRIPACCPSPTERPYYSHLRERRFGVGSCWGRPGALCLFSAQHKGC